MCRPRNTVCDRPSVPRAPAPKSQTPTLVAALLDTSRLALSDIGTLSFTSSLSLAIGFGTVYFTSSTPRSGTLKTEFLAWGASPTINLVVPLYGAFKLYSETDEVVTYRMDQGTPLVDAKPPGQESA